MTSYRYPQGRILVMARAPIPGQAKTRLIPALGEEGAARLHQELSEALLLSLHRAAIAPIQLWCSPDTGHPFFAHCAQHYGLSLHRQSGGDLGERMHHALGEALKSEQVEFAMVVGCDIPALDACHLHQACEHLAEGRQAVLLPMEDGGYGLLGVRENVPALFNGIDWGSDRVLAQTRQRLGQLAWCWQELATLWDVDRPEDLSRLSRFRQGLW
jgi:rSAM/selenodomain-associated transferase 1